MNELTFIYNKLKTTYTLVLTDTLTLKSGYTIDVPVIRGTAPDRSFDLYKDEGMFVLSTVVRGKNSMERYEHEHPLDAEDAIAAIKRFMPLYITAHAHCTDNKKELQNSKQCGCFHCLAIFASEEVKEYIKEGDGTALCPKCGIDSVIGDASGVPITMDFLKEMQAHWFETNMF